VDKKVKFYDRNFYTTKHAIDEISDSFCAAKWLQVSLHLTNGKTHSCYHPPTHDIDRQDLEIDPSSLHNTKQKFLERKMMLEGQRPPGCEYCWKIEDSGHVSDRYYRSSEHWAVDKIDHIKNLPYDYLVNPTYVEVNFNQTCNFKCSYCSPHLSSTWEEEVRNFGPYKIGDTLHNHLATLQNAGLMPVSGGTKNNLYLESFWQWWPDLYLNLKVFRMTGGEPLMDANTFKVLDYVIEHPNKNLELSVTSNLCPPKDLFEKFLSKIKSLDRVNHEVECYVPDPKNGSPWQEWPHYIIGAENKSYHNSDLPSIERNKIPETFEGIGHAKENGSFTYLYSYQDYACKHFTLYVSLDSVGSQAEYIRNGLDFQMLEQNIDRFLSETENTSVSFINTFNRLSIPSLRKYLEMILNLRKKFSGAAQRLKGTKRFQRIWFDIPLLRKPEWLSVLNCDSDDIKILKDVLIWMEENESRKYGKNMQGFRPYEIEKLQRNIDVIENNKFDGITKINNNKNFKEFFNEHDKRRGTNFEISFPELADWYRNL
jgi:hypothetical protein